MKLFIKRDKTADDSLFVVFDEVLNEKYYVTKPGSSILIKDTGMNTVAKIKSLPLPSLRAYSLTACGRNIKFFMGKKCYFYGTSWSIRGSIPEKSFDIIDGDNSIVATHSRRFGKSGDGYELNVYPEHCELLCVATAVCVNLGVTADCLKPVTV